MGSGNGEDKIRLLRWNRDSIFPQRRARLERQWIEEALRRHSGKITPAAVDLGVPRPTLYDLMKQHGVQGTEFRD